MTDQEIIEIISEGIVDGTDMDCTVKDQARAVLKALRDAGALSQWQPIETAPKDGSIVDLWVIPFTGRAGRLPDVWWTNATGWRAGNRNPVTESLAKRATHWMPLPEAPQ